MSDGLPVSGRPFLLCSHAFAAKCEQNRKIDLKKEQNRYIIATVPITLPSDDGAGSPGSSSGSSTRNVRLEIATGPETPNDPEFKMDRVRRLCKKED